MSPIESDWGWAITAVGLGMNLVPGAMPKALRRIFAGIGWVLIFIRKCRVIRSGGGSAYFHSSTRREVMQDARHRRKAVGHLQGGRNRNLEADGV